MLRSGWSGYRIPVGARFSAPVQTGSFQGIKRPGLGLNHISRSNAEVEERVELWRYSHSVPSDQVIGWKYLTYFNMNFSFNVVSESTDNKPRTEPHTVHILEYIPLILTSIPYSQIWPIFTSALPLLNKTLIKHSCTSNIRATVPSLSYLLNFILQVITANPQFTNMHN